MIEKYVAVKNAAGIQGKYQMAQSKLSVLEGKEIAVDYVRTSLPQGRWGDTWGLFKSCFGKLVLINVLTLLFCVPGIALVVIRTTYIAQMGMLYPFSANVLGSYPVTPSMTGGAERIVLFADLMYFALLIAAGFIASVGLAGGSYAVRKLINTHGEFTFRGYFRGVKACYFRTLFAVTLALVFVFAAVCVSDWAAYATVMGTPAGGPVTAQVFAIIAAVVVGIICLWLLSVGVSYRLTPGKLLKLSLSLCFRTIVQTLFMVAFSLIPVWLLLIGMASTFFLVVGYIVCVLFGVSFVLLCWFAYSQWVFDLFNPPVVQEEKDVKGAKAVPAKAASAKTEAEVESEEKLLARELLAFGKSELIGRPIKPIESTSAVSDVGRAYGRAQIAQAAQARSDIEGEVREYYEQHKDDARYAEYAKLFAEREKALKTPEGRKGKKKKVSSRNLLR